MKILVAIKRVIDYNIKVRIKPDGSDVDLNNIKMALNPFCEIAVEEAIRLKEKGVASEVIVVSIGEQAAQEQIRTALALGADRGIHVQTEGAVNSLSVAKVLNKIIEKENIELVILGKQSIDSDNNQTGQMLAALSNRSQGTFASKLVVNQDNQTIEVTREVDGGLQVLTLQLPAVITTDLRLNEPRYASLPNIMKARKKPIEQFTFESLAVKQHTTLETVRVEPPQERQPGIKVKSVDELLDKLRNEAKVI